MKLAKKVLHDSSISVIFNIEADKMIEIGEKMQEINDAAYMNGYNWEAVLNFYLPKYHPDVFEGMDSDPEASMYAAYYSVKNTENEKKADKLVEILESLAANEEKLYEIVRKYGDEIEWD